MSGSFGGVQVNQLLQRFIDEFFNRSTLNQIRQEQIRLIISALGDDQLHYWLHTQRLTSAVVSLADCYTPPPHLLTGCHSDGSAWFSLHRPLICMTKMERRSNGWRLAACWPVRPPPPPPPHPLLLLGHRARVMEREEERISTLKKERKKSQVEVMFSVVCWYQAVISSSDQTHESQQNFKNKQQQQKKISVHLHSSFSQLSFFFVSVQFSKLTKRCVNSQLHELW